MPKGFPKNGVRAPVQKRVYRPDLHEHFCLVHPRRQLGIIRFNRDKTKAYVCDYSFDADGDMSLGKSSWKTIAMHPYGMAIKRKDKIHYLKDFIVPPANPYA